MNKTVHMIFKFGKIEIWRTFLVGVPIHPDWRYCLGKQIDSVFFKPQQNAWRTGDCSQILHLCRNHINLPINGQWKVNQRQRSHVRPVSTGEMLLILSSINHNKQWRNFGSGCPRVKMDRVTPSLRGRGVDRIWKVGERGEGTDFHYVH